MTKAQAIRNNKINELKGTVGGDYSRCKVKDLNIMIKALERDKKIKLFVSPII